jgi:hypothetical protein
VEDAHGEPVEVLAKRDGRFDSSFPETGPPPVLTASGIVVRAGFLGSRPVHGRAAIGPVWAVTVNWQRDPSANAIVSPRLWLLLLVRSGTGRGDEDV